MAQGAVGGPHRAQRQHVAVGGAGTYHDTPLTVLDSGILSNDNASGGTLTAMLDSQPTFGTITNWDGQGGFRNDRKITSRYSITPSVPAPTELVSVERMIDG
jgi:hypothetical protein